MITSSSEYMERLNDIQNQAGLKQLIMLPGNESRFIIDANQRTITIPDEFTFLGVKNDHKAETIYFEIDRYFDKADLSEKTCIVQFESIDTTEGSEQVISSGFYPVVKMDVDTADGKIIFGWEIQNDATAYAVNVRFSIRFYETKIENDTIVFAYNFNTLPVELPVKDSLDTMDEDKEILPAEVEGLVEKFTTMAKSIEKDVVRANTAVTNAEKFTLTQNEKNLMLVLFKKVSDVYSDVTPQYEELNSIWSAQNEEVT